MTNTMVLGGGLKIKLDENMPASAVSLLQQKGHDIHTVFDEALNGEVDEKIAETCRKERRILITLDSDFSDIRSYPPKDNAGIILLRPHRQSEPQIIRLLESVLPMFQSEPIHGFLWVVESAGLRIR
jgi:predicted nuclease of predicted toxin-antitoxin system